MAEPRRLTQLVSSARERLRLPGGDLVIALSGGADSAALAYLCLQEGRNLRALHVDHQLPGSSLMEKAARTVAETLEIELEVVSVDVPEGASPEGQARRARYRAFGDSTRSGEQLLTGHTKDDQAETVLHNIIRGTGVRGLTGIPYYRPPSTYRPILEIGRSETREIAALAGLGFVDDPMNEDPGLTRNVIRSQILPVLSQLNPRITEALIRVSSALGSDVDFLERATPDRLVKAVDGVVSAPVGALGTLPKALVDRLLMSMLATAGGGTEVTAERIARLRVALEPDKGEQELGGGLVAVRDGPMLMIRHSPEPPSPELPLDLTPGLHRYGRLEFDVALMSGRCRVIPLSRWSAVFPGETRLVVGPDGVVSGDGEPAWVPGRERYPVAWYEPGEIGYLSVSAREKTGWTSSRS